MLVLPAILICFLLSAFFSGSEMAFVSCNRLKVRHWASEGNRAARIIKKMQQEAGQFLASILFGNNLVNVTVTALATYFFESRLGIDNELVVTAWVAPLLIIFAETLPKGYGQEKADQIIYPIAPFLLVFYRLTSWIAEGLVSVSDRLLSPFGATEKKSPFVTREEFYSLMEEGSRKGILDPEQKRLVDMILNFERIRVREVMVPLSQVPMVEIGSRIRDVRRKAKETQSTYFLVYEALPSIVMGIVFVYDMLFEKNENRTLRDYLRPPLFLSGETSAERAFLRLQEGRQSIALVLDENREVMGVLRVENLLL